MRSQRDMYGGESSDMETIIITISKYLLLLFMLIYTFECFSVFRYGNEESRKHIYLRQNIWMFFLQAVAYLAHPVLRKRLIEISGALLHLKTDDPEHVFGYPDNLKGDDIPWGASLREDFLHRESQKQA